MDYIKGTLRILGDIEYLRSDTAFYTPIGVDEDFVEISENVKIIAKDLVEFKLNLGMYRHFELTFDTYQSARGMYEAVLYPVEYGKLLHIFCIGPLEGIDILDTWQYGIVEFNDKSYYLYVSETKKKDRGLTYRFVVEN